MTDADTVAAMMRYLRAHYDDRAARCGLIDLYRGMGDDDRADFMTGGKGPENGDRSPEALLDRCLSEWYPVGHIRGIEWYTEGDVPPCGKVFIQSLVNEPDAVLTIDGGTLEYLEIGRDEWLAVADHLYRTTPVTEVELLGGEGDVTGDDIDAYAVRWPGITFVIPASPRYPQQWSVSAPGATGPPDNYRCYDRPPDNYRCYDRPRPLT